MRNLSTLLALIIVLFLTIISTKNLSAQYNTDRYKLKFKSGEYLPPNGITSFKDQNNFNSKHQIDNRYYVLMQFTGPLNELDYQELKAASVNLLKSFQAYTYMVSVPTQTDVKKLERKVNIRSIVPMPVSAKLSTSINDNNIPKWAVNEPGKIDVNIVLQKDINYSSALNKLVAEGIQILDDSYSKYQLLSIRISENKLTAFAENCFVDYIEPIESPLEHLNHKGPQSTKTSYLTSVEGLTGKGVVVGVGDGGNVDHIDYVNKFLHQTATADANWGNHPFHIVGTIAGAGNKEQWFRGMAYNAKIITEHSSSIILYTSDHYNDFGMSLTNNSYGPNSFSCTASGEYNSSSITIDQNSVDNPKVLHLFAAGNSGDSDCNPYPYGFGTVLRSYASSKNALIVGAIRHRGQEASFSSRGPVRDGRTKPEVVTSGYYVVSCDQNNSYKGMHGTSMATATATGAATIITEAFMNNNKGEKPEGDLLKAIIANSAQDAGNEGPDYTYGFGMVDAKRAVETIKNERYVTGTLTNGVTKHEFINVPEGVHQVKVMLYWHDQPGSGSLTKSLVNDLDMEVLNTNNATFKPWVLDPTPQNVNLPATRGVDNLNNIEQVTLTGNEITNGLAVTITGTSIPMGPQRYILVYDFIKPSVELTYPAGGENFAPNYKTEIIRWESYGPDSKNVSLEYSLDNGNSWDEFNLSQENRDLKYYNWAIPNNYRSETARIRVSINGTSYKSMNAKPFTIIPTPTNLEVGEICENTVRLTWDSSSEAEFYEVMRLDTTMKVVGQTATTCFTIGGLTSGQEEWFTVRPVTRAGNRGSRMVALNATPSSIACTETVDVGVSLIISPTKDGRAFTSTSLEAQSVIVEIQNFGTVPASNFPVIYQVNDETEVIEIFTGTLNPGERTEFTFATPTSMDSPGSYIITAKTDINEDTEHTNDAPIRIPHLTQHENEPLRIFDFPIQLGFENSTPETYQENEIGFSGIDRGDFMTIGIGGRMKINANPDFNLPESSKAITLDATYPVNANDITNDLILTYNLTNFTMEWQELKLDFSYMQHVISPDPDNKIFVRGSDTNDWIEIYSFYGNQSTNGIYKNISDLDLLGKLIDSNHPITSSFQIRFSQRGSTFAENISEHDGFTFDNITLKIGWSLPVELVSFDAIKKEGDALLIWTTESETNNNYFEIQVAEEDAVGNLAEYRVLDQAEGAGTTNSRNEYEYLDTETGKEGRRYYRLKQVDYDGAFEYSDIKVVDFRNHRAISVEIFPNPVLEVLNIKVDSEENDKLQIKVSNTEGRVMETLTRSTKGGSSIETIKLDDRYANGFYIVNMRIGDLSKSHKVLKVSNK